LKHFLSFAIVFLSVLPLCFANKHEHKKDRGQKHLRAHVHGSGNLNIAFDKTNGKIEFKSSADAILGFEHNPKSESEIKLLTETIDSFKKQASDWISFDKKTNCIFENELADLVVDKDDQSHADFTAVYKIKCTESPLGSKLKIDFSKFKNLKNLDIALIIDDVQKSAKYKGKFLEILLGK
jgi:hypothetical protein